MKEQRAQRLFRSLTHIGDDLIQEAQPVKPQRTLWLRWGAAAACLCLIAAGGLAALSGSEGTSQDAAETTTSRGSQSPLPYQHSNACRRPRPVIQARPGVSARTLVPFAMPTPGTSPGNGSS